MPKFLSALFLLTPFLLTPFLTLAQAPHDTGTPAAKNTSSALRGRIVDKDNKGPIHFASVTLLRKDSTTVTGLESQEDGGFTIGQLPDEPLILKVSFVGYQSFFRNIPSPRKLPLNLGTISLVADASQLQTVVVSAEKSAFKVETDKKIFNVDKSLASKGGTAVDALRQVPTLNVSASGNISLRNGAPVILLDGKRTTLSLDQIPADQIQSVEVMPNPSAKYDAQGNNGIVNIVMKKNRKPGINGSVTGVWNSLGENYGFFNLNAYKKRWNFNLNLMTHHHRNAGTTTTTRDDLTDHTSLLQHSRNETTGPFHKVHMGADFFMDDHNTFSLSGDIGFGSHPTTTTQQTSYLDPTGKADSSSFRRSYDGRKFTFAHVNFDYAHEFNKTGEKWTASGALENYYSPTPGNYSMQYLDKSGMPSGSPYLQNYSSLVRAPTVTLQSDYTDPLRDGKAKLEAGIKAILHRDHSYNLIGDYDSSSNSYIRDLPTSYNYRYSDNTYSAYGSYSDKIGEFSYMAGLRFEQYNYKGVMIDTNLNFAYHTTGVYPSLFLTEKLDSRSELHLNYSRRINRPDFGQISPRTDYSNPQNPQQGNPDLRPENTNLLELSYNTLFNNTSVATTFFIKNTLNAITSYSIPLSQDTLLGTYKNANSNNTYGAEIVVKVPVVKWWSTTTNVNLFQTSINADNLSEGLSNSGFSWFAKLNSDMKVSELFTFQLTGIYSGPEVMAQGKTLASGGLDAAIKKDLLKNKAATLVISLSDVLNTERERTQTYSENLFFQDVINKPITRVLKINFTYIFGKDRFGKKPSAPSTPSA
ncbi:MAG: TonB-dependent receptor [Puia sp.]|nr:TonB-dependent receptor [Puia sp.]